MARPRTEIGTAGRITLVPQVERDGRWVTAPESAKPDRWRARAKHRDTDGRLRDVERFAPTKGKAEARLKAALSGRTARADRGITGMRAEMTVVDAGRFWLAQVARPDSGLSASTGEQYRSAFARYVESSSIAHLSLREANRVPVLRAYLQGLADKHGTGSAKTARSVLAGVFRLAVTDGALEGNALRDVRPAKASAARVTVRDTDRALTREERDHVLAVADAHKKAVDLDVADLMWFLAGTGARISEALAQAWPDVDLAAGKVHVRGTKTDHSDRVLTVPAWLRDRLAARAERMGTVGLVFPSPGTFERHRQRDRRNVARVFREVLDDAGVPWATPHTFRRTVATLIDQAGLAVAEAADYLGHADPSMTARVYLGRRATSARVAAAL